MLEMQAGDDAPYDFFEQGPKAFALIKGRNYRRIKSETGRIVYQKLIRRCSGF